MTDIVKNFHDTVERLKSKAEEIECEELRLKVIETLMAYGFHS